MRSKVKFGHPKWPTSAIVKNFKQIKVVYWSEMARNATKSDFRTSKMAAGSHFVKKKITKKTKQLSCILIWNGQKCDRKWISDIQDGRRRPFCKNNFLKKVSYWSKMDRNATESDFRTSIMAAGSHFAEWFEQCSNRLLADYNLI